MPLVRLECQAYCRGEYWNTSCGPRQPAAFAPRPRTDIGSPRPHRVFVEDQECPLAIGPANARR